MLADLGQRFITGMDDKYTRGYNVNRVVRRLVRDDSLLDIEQGASVDHASDGAEGTFLGRD